jgi:hypothetical protein
MSGEKAQEVDREEQEQVAFDFISQYQHGDGLGIMRTHLIELKKIER